MLFRFAVLILLFVSGRAEASCAFAEQAEKSGKINIAFMQYIYCAEEENDPEAQYKLGTMYYQGVGLPRPDFRRAAAFFSRGASNGYAPAQVKLGLLYWRGEGVEKNLKMAHKWMYLAQEQADMRWFYYVGPSSDPSAASMYAKIDSVLKNDKSTISLPLVGDFSLDFLQENIPPSYKEIAEFQHEQLLEAGKELLDERSQSDLQLFLNNLKPDINPKLPADFPNDQKQSVFQMISDWFKPVMLTPKNLTPSKIPVLEKLKNEIETSAE
ncbi:MAG: sel1 repeat family protein [Alphaproteobacteria bacterium]|nr:sel1 repeat family protein [Alphaproteobacteria bacterium]